MDMIIATTIHTMENKMIDIHSHVLHAVDDGSKDIDTSIEMIKHEISIGVDTIVCTPHYILGKYTNTVDELTNRFTELVNKVKELDLKVNLLLGEEICYTRRVNIIDMLDKKELLTINNTRYILLEFDYVTKPEGFEDIIYNFKLHDYKVIIAHIERYKWMDINTIKYLKDEGAIIQVNSNSIIGANGIKNKLLVNKLIKLGLVDIIASDTHSFRVSSLDKAYAKLKNPKLFEFNKII